MSNQPKAKPEFDLLDALATGIKKGVDTFIEENDIHRQCVADAHSEVITFYEYLSSRPLPDGVVLGPKPLRYDCCIFEITYPDWLGYVLVVSCNSESLAARHRAIAHLKGESDDSFLTEFAIKYNIAISPKIPIGRSLDDLSGTIWG